MSINTSNGHNLIEAPVSIADIQYVLSVSSGDLGTLCKSTYINKWAKYKPISYANLINTTPQLKGGTGNDKNQWADSATWWKGSDEHCGFEIVSSPRVWEESTPDTSKNASTLESEARSLDDWFNNGWNYLFYPKGGLASPYRQIDFNYYDHSAVPFVKSIQKPSVNTIFAGNDGGSMTWTMVLPTSEEAKYSLGFGDFTLFKGSSSSIVLSSCHFGLIFVNVGSQFPDYSNMLYRKYVVTNPYPISNSSGKSITLTGQQTASLVNDGNIVSEQEYLVYPIITTGAINSNTMVVFGTASFGSMVVIPNSSTFKLSLVPNELEGFLEGGGLEEEYKPVTTQDYINNSTYISVINRSTKNVSVSSIDLGMEIWQKIGGNYSLNGTVSSGYTFPGVSFPLTINAGASMSIPISWTIGSSSFQAYQDYKLRETGTITYTKSGSSSSSTSTLLSNPPYKPDNVIIPKLFQSHITVDSVTSSSFYVKIWVENIREIDLDFTWSSLLYDIVSYPIETSGTDYNNVLVQDNNTITGNTERVSAGGTSSVKQIQIEPRRGTLGYMASVTVHSNTGYNVGDSTATANYITK